MKGPGDLGELKSGQWEQLESLADRLEQAWSAAPQEAAVDLSRFLPTVGDALRGVALVELVKTDLEIRWRRGQRVRLDYYVERFPDLGTVGTVVADLIYEEYRVRQMHGDRPPLEAYEERFPAQYARLRQIVEEQPIPTLDISNLGATPSRPTTAPPGRNTKSQEPFSEKSARLSIEPTPPPARPTGQGHTLSVVGGYKFIKRIGSGSFGEVWLAEAPGGIRAAVKMILRPLDQEEAQRELQSLETIKNLQHPFLLSTQAYWPLEDRLYIVMELAEGSIRDRVKQCRTAGQPGLPLPEMLTYVKESAEALDYLHNQGVQHRDVKPENILILQGHAKVADFGLAKMMESQRVQASATSAGTPIYMAPETWRGKVSKHSDQYSLAMMVAELRLNRRLFQASDMMGLMIAHLEQIPDLAPLVQAEQEVILRGLAKDSDQRYGSCVEFAKALERAVGPQLRRSSPDAYFDMDTPTGMRPGSRFETEAMGTLTPGMAGGDARTALGPGSWQGPPPSGGRRIGVAALGAVAAVALAFLAWTFLKPGSFEIKAPPLAIHADQTRPLTLRVKRDSFSGPIALTFDNVPDKVAIEPATVPEGADEVEVPVSVAADAPPTTAALAVRAEANGQTKDISLDLSVLPLATLPPGFQADGLSVVTSPVTGLKYYQKIACVKDGQKVVLNVIPQDDKHRDPATFYIMENKVWNGLFGVFAETHPEFFKEKNDWVKGGREKNKLGDKPPYIDIGNGNPLHPALRMTVVQAHHFAEWLGNGHLPDVAEWERAAGYFESNTELPARDGDFQLGGAAPDVALQRGDVGPLEVGAAKKDISRFGIRDVYGNGLEWTRELVGPGKPKTVPLVERIPDQDVAVRGRGYDNKKIVLFNRGEFKRELYKLQAPGPVGYDNIQDNLGFRVVVDPPR